MVFCPIHFKYFHGKKEKALHAEEHKCKWMKQYLKNEAYAKKWNRKIKFSIVPEFVLRKIYC
jgi:hypothetical protein